MISTELQTSDPQRLVEIGGYLRQLREAQGMSLELVEQQTKIQKFQLVAIEQGNISQLPPTIYIQGFIKIYANLLGCDGRALAATFPAEFP